MEGQKERDRERVKGKGRTFKKEMKKKNKSIEGLMK